MPKRILAVALLAAAASSGLAQPAPSATYVAMGSSYAAGPGVAERAPGAPPQCAQSTQNYARLFAQRRGLTLRDVSCSGATTESILHGGQGLPPQLDAVGSETKLVTITIGGNDVAFIRNLYAWSCQNEPVPAQAEASKPEQRHCGAPMPNAEIETAFAGLEDRFRAIVTGIQARAPAARIVFVDYVRIVPGTAACPDRLPLTPAEMEQTRTVAARLAALTAHTAQAIGALDLKASELSEGHEVCSADPWAMPFHAPPGTPPGHFAAYHPNTAAMQAIATQLEKLFP